MDLAIILSAAGLMLSLQVALVVQIFHLSEKVSRLCGRFDIQIKSCEERFKQIEDRLTRHNI